MYGYAYISTIRKRVHRRRMTSMSTSVSPNPEATAREAVNARIHGLLFKARLTKRELAERLHLGSTATSRKLNGHAPWTLDELMTLSTVLETSVAYLVGEVSSDAPLRATSNAQRLSAADAEMVGRTGLEPVTDGL
ncbi:MAG: hypothetical protein GXX90_00115 [Microbacteriaceae bacterium]|nr:hypothetical protein [Microbacteriaceae bacterium]